MFTYVSKQGDQTKFVALRWYYTGAGTAPELTLITSLTVTACEHALGARYRACFKGVYMGKRVLRGLTPLWYAVGLLGVRNYPVQANLRCGFALWTACFQCLFSGLRSISTMTRGEIPSTRGGAQSSASCAPPPRNAAPRTTVTPVKHGVTAAW